MSEFRCESEHIGDHAAIVTVTGDLDLETAPWLRDEIARLHAQGVGRHLIVDLLGVGLMDSTGLGVLVAAQRQTVGRLHLVVAAASLTDIFRLTGLDGLFLLRPSREEALTQLKERLVEEGLL